MDKKKAIRIGKEVSKKLLDMGVSDTDFELRSSSSGDLNGNISESIVLRIFQKGHKKVIERLIEDGWKRTGSYLNSGSLSFFNSPAFEDSVLNLPELRSVRIVVLELAV